MTLEQADQLPCLFVESDHFGFDGVAELIEQLEEAVYPDRLMFPLYFWATTATPFEIDVSRVIETEAENHFEDVEEHLNGELDLAAAVERFNKLNSNVCSYFPDHTKVFVIESRDHQESLFPAGS